MDQLCFVAVGSRNPYRTGPPPRLELRSHFDEGSLLAQVSFTEALGRRDWGLGWLAITTESIIFSVHNRKHGNPHDCTCRTWVSFYMKVTTDYLAVVFFYL